MSEETATAAAESVCIHVRFAPNGTVTQIGECPAAVPPQAWFDKLTTIAGDRFQALSGGRGVFFIERRALDQATTA